MGSIIFSSVTEEKTQADGAFDIALDAQDRFLRHQVQAEVSATPATGSLSVAVRSPGATDFVTLDGTIDLTGSELLKTFGPVFAAEIRITPTGFDADKTYNLIITSGVDG